MSQIIAELVTVDSSEETADLHFYDLGNLETVEMDRRLVRKIKRNMAMMMELIDGETKYNYEYPRRTRFEVEAGFRRALARGARLNETKVFNVLFRFRNKKIDAFALAVMYRAPHNNEEWILLMPDDTEATIRIEKEAFMSKALIYLKSAAITRDHYNNLQTNLELLTVPERCAQTLQHEYGHILHWRMFDRLRFDSEDMIYLWFLESGYADLTALRFPRYISLPDEEKVYFLKEALVEDYRISLNLRDKTGIFIVPNKITYYGDLIIPEFMEEGVRIMETMLGQAISGQTGQRKASQQREIDTVTVLNETHDWIVKNNWKPGAQSMTRADHLAVVKRLRHKHVAKMVAASRE